MSTRWTTTICVTNLFVFWILFCVKIQSWDSVQEKCWLIYLSFSVSTIMWTTWMLDVLLYYFNCIPVFYSSLLSLVWYWCVCVQIDVHEFSIKQLLKQTLSNQVKAYLSSHHISKELRHRIDNWYQHLHINKKIIRENEILQELPLHLRTEIAVSVHLSTLSKVTIFHNCDRSLLEELVLKLTPQVRKVPSNSWHLLLANNQSSSKLISTFDCTSVKMPPLNTDQCKMHLIKKL